MSVFVTDTHPLLWFTLDQQRNLSKDALDAFTAADEGRAYIHIPSMVLYEVAILEHQGKIKLNERFIRWSENLLANESFGLVALDHTIINAAVGYAFNGDPFDKVIVATAAEMSLPLITRDSAITNAGLVELLW